jgi:hypothetical protein
MEKMNDWNYLFAWNPCADCPFGLQTKYHFWPFLPTIVAVVPFSEVLLPKLKQFFQINFAAVEGVCVLMILILVIHPVFLTFFFFFGGPSSCYKQNKFLK